MATEGKANGAVVLNADLGLCFGNKPRGLPSCVDRIESCNKPQPSNGRQSPRGNTNHSPIIVRNKLVEPEFAEHDVKLRERPVSSGGDSAQHSPVTLRSRVGASDGAVFNHWSLEELRSRSPVRDAMSSSNSSPPCIPRNMTYPCISEDEVMKTDAVAMDDDDDVYGAMDTSVSGKPPMATMRRHRVGLHRSHTWTACDVPFDKRYSTKRKSDSLRQGLLSRRHRSAMSLQNVFCLVKETSINSVKTLIKLFEMNVVRGAPVCVRVCVCVCDLIPHDSPTVGACCLQMLQHSPCPRGCAASSATFTLSALSSRSALSSLQRCSSR